MPKKTPDFSQCWCFNALKVYFLYDQLQKNVHNMKTPLFFQFIYTRALQRTNQAYRGNWLYTSVMCLTPIDIYVIQIMRPWAIHVFAQLRVANYCTGSCFDLLSFFFWCPMCVLGHPYCRWDLERFFLSCPLTSNKRPSAIFNEIV